MKLIIGLSFVNQIEQITANLMSGITQSLTGPRVQSNYIAHIPLRQSFKLESKIFNSPDNSHHNFRQSLTNKPQINRDNNRGQTNLLTRQCYISPEKHKGLFTGCSEQLMKNFNTNKGSICNSTSQTDKQEQINREKTHYGMFEKSNNKICRKKTQVFCDNSESRRLGSPRPFSRKPAQVTNQSNQVFDYKMKIESLEAEKRHFIEIIEGKTKLHEKSEKEYKQKIEQLTTKNTVLAANLEQSTKHSHLLDHLISKLRYQIQQEAEISDRLNVQNQKLKSNLKKMRQYILNKQNDEGEKVRKSFPSKLNFRDMNQFYHKKRALGQNTAVQNDKENTQRPINIESKKNIGLLSPTSRTIQTSPSGSFFELSPD